MLTFSFVTHNVQQCEQQITNILYGYIYPILSKKLELAYVLAILVTWLSGLPVAQQVMLRWLKQILA